MNAIVQAALDAAIADLEVTSSIPAAPYGYGGDMWCESDLDPRMTEISDTALVLAQYAVRRLDTPDGLPDDPNWGMSISEYCLRPTTRREIAALAGEIVAELRDDDRIDTVSAAVAVSTDYTTLTATIRIVPMDPEAGEFTLTLSVSDSEIRIEEMVG
jgi:hypothetical protein